MHKEIDGDSVVPQPSMPALTGLRGAAAVAVVFVHLHLPAYFLITSPVFVAFREFGWIGVPMFFVLSGYLITCLGCNENHDRGSFNLGRFFLRRILRIWPIYFVAVATAEILFYVPHLTQLGAAPRWLIPLCTFSTNFSMVARHSGAGLRDLTPMWTLSAEMQFYAISGVCLWLSSLCIDKTFSVRLLLSFGVAALIVFTCLRLFWAFAAPPESYLLYRVNPLVSAGSPLIGCLAALARKPVIRFLERPAGFTLAFACVIGAVALVGTALPEAPWGRFLLTTAVDVYCALLVLICAVGSGRLAHFLSTKLMMFLGQISYSLYVIHSGVLTVFYALRGRLLFPSPILHPYVALTLDTVIIFMVAISVSALLTRLEAPIRNFRNRICIEARPRPL